MKLDKKGTSKGLTLCKEHITQCDDSSKLAIANSRDEATCRLNVYINYLMCI